MAQLLGENSEQRSSAARDLRAREAPRDFAGNVPRAATTTRFAPDRMRAGSRETNDDAHLKRIPASLRRVTALVAQGLEPAGLIIKQRAAALLTTENGGEGEAASRSKAHGSIPSSRSHTQAVMAILPSSSPPLPTFPRPSRSVTISRLFYRRRRRRDD